MEEGVAEVDEVWLDAAVPIDQHGQPKSPAWTVLSSRTGWTVD